MSTPTWVEPDQPLPPPEMALDEPNGLLAAGLDLSVNRLLEAYPKGIFPWFEQGQPVLWWSPDPRLILTPPDIHISRSLRKSIRRQGLSYTVNKAFKQVIAECAAPRAESDDTWITDDMQQVYQSMHECGYAHSVEVWQQQRLVGGLYGIGIDQVFFGESMFSRVSDASKFALVALGHHASHWGIELIDCQVETDHLSSMGAFTVSRQQFLNKLSLLCKATTKQPWDICEPMEL